MLDLAPLERLRKNNEQKAIAALRGVCFNGNEKPLLINISLNIFPSNLYFVSGDDLNGASHLLQIMQGVVKPSSGQIFFKSNLRKTYLNPYELNTLSSLTLDQIINLLIDQNKDFNEYSFLKSKFDFKVSDQSKLSEIKVMDQRKFLWILTFLQDPDLILADKMMEGLDLEEQVKLLAFIKQRMNERAFSTIFSEKSLEVTKHVKSDVLILQDGIIDFRMRS